VPIDPPRPEPYVLVEENLLLEDAIAIWRVLLEIYLFPFEWTREPVVT